VLHDAVFVDDDVGTLRPFIGIALNVVAFQNAVGRQHLFVHIAEQREFDFSFLGKGGVGSGESMLTPKNFGIRCIDFSCVDSRLDRLELFGSTAGESKHVDREQHVLFALIVAELNVFH